LNGDTSGTWPACGRLPGGGLAGRRAPGREPGRRLAGHRRHRPRPGLASPTHVSY